MSISRRHFLLFSGSALVTVGTSFSMPLTKRYHPSLAKNLPTHSNDKLRQMHASTFERLNNKKFQVLNDQGSQIQLQLAQIEAQNKSEQLEQFSLVFRGAKKQALVQGNYQFKHPKLGKFNLFIVPTDQPAHYQATFSRLVA